ncbi:MAG TPA: hypothetical protein PK170_00475 [Anaerolineae bacterium]|nr:hypothetical protein [Anaerolineae bacterium]
MSNRKLYHKEPAMAQIRWWLARLIIIGSVLAGCTSSPDFGHQETPTMAEPTYIYQESIKEGTVSHWENGGSIGVEAISRGRYVDEDGHEQTGVGARISIALGRDEPAQSIIVYKGTVFSVGDQRFQVIELKPNSSLSVMPGSSNGYIVIGQLP